MNRLLKYLHYPRYLALAVAASSASLLAAAYISQYGFGLKPCILCLYQRAPYALNIVLGFFAYLASYRYPRLALLLLCAAGVSFFVDAGIAGFHVGVEHGWWKGLAECGGDLVPKGGSIEELRRVLEHQNIVRCDKPAFVLYGISMAGYNFAAALVLGFETLYMLLRKNNGA
jgi:disulfide bond formation protein DsbB